MINIFLIKTFLFISALMTKYLKKLYEFYATALLHKILIFRMGMIFCYLFRKITRLQLNLRS